MSREVSVEVQVGGRSIRGYAVDLRQADRPESAAEIDGETVVAAVRADGASDEGDPASGVTVDCPNPGPVHERVGHVRPGMGLRVRTALAEAARSRGLDAPQDDDLRTARDRFATLDAPEPPDTESARSRLAGTESTVVELRERVASLRGRVQAAREADRDASALEDELADAVRELSERETERLAAREHLEHARERAHDARAVREERRRLEDRIANLERAARTHLVEELRTTFVANVQSVPGCDFTPADGDPFDVDAVTAALAVARVARLRAPVVLACERFPDAAVAADWLGAPVIRV